MRMFKTALMMLCVLPAFSQEVNNGSWFLFASMPQGELKTAYDGETGYGLGWSTFLKDSGRIKVDYTAYEVNSGGFSNKFTSLNLGWDTHPADKQTKPYFLLGLGWAWSKSEFSFGGISDSASDNTLTLDVGVGYKIDSGYIELYYRDMKFGGTGAFESVKAPSFNLAVGFYY